MSQASLRSSTPVAPSFPPLVYRNIPVLTTEMLAQAYDVAPKQIRQNFANNRERFIEGKHFFSLSGQELKDFRLCVENFDSQISTKVRVLILYTDRGCARHAKSLNTDRAWDMYELLEETFFAVKSTSPQVFLSTPADRKQLEVKALPAAPRFDEAAMLELAAEIREAQQNYSRTFGRLCSRLITMSIPIFTALESRVYKQAPDRPFHGTRVGAQWDRYFTERMIAALHSFDDRLPDEKNPAILLLEYARAMSAR